MINPEDATALTPAERMLVESWTDEERQAVQRVFSGDEDIRHAISFVCARREILRASEQAIQEKYA